MNGKKKPRLAANKVPNDLLTQAQLQEVRPMATPKHLLRLRREGRLAGWKLGVRNTYYSLAEYDGLWRTTNDVRDAG